MLTLREIEEEDVNDFMEWAGDDEVTKYLLWDSYTSKEAALNFIRNVAKPHPWYRAICWNNKPIGSLSLTPGQGVHSCRAELGYVLNRSYWNKGLMTQAVKIALDLGFKQLDIARIEATVSPDNVASQKVLIKSGFTNTGLQRCYILVKGRLRDCYMFAISQSRS